MSDEPTPNLVELGENVTVELHTGPDGTANIAPTEVEWATVTAASVWSAPIGGHLLDYITGRAPVPGEEHWATAITSSATTVAVLCHCGHRSEDDNQQAAIEAHLDHSHPARPT